MSTSHYWPADARQHALSIKMKLLLRTEPGMRAPADRGDAWIRTDDHEGVEQAWTEKSSRGAGRCRAAGGVAQFHPRLTHNQQDPSFLGILACKI